MSNRVGSLVIFKPGVTKAQAEAALRKIADMVEPGMEFTRQGVKRLDGPAVNEYNEDHGSPTWYIP